MREETKIKMLDIRFNAVKQEQLLEEVFRNIEEKKEDQHYVRKCGCGYKSGER